MNMMLFWKRNRPMWAPADEGGAGAEGGSGEGTETGQEGAGEGGQAAGQEGTAGQGEGQAATPDYSFLPEQFRSENGPDIDGFKAHYETLEAAAAREAERNTGVPEDATGYEFSIPDDIDYKAMGLPDDFGGFTIDAENEALKPVLSEFGEVLHKHGLPQSAASDFMRVLAKYEGMTQKATMDAQQAAVAQVRTELGNGADARVADIKRAAEARLPAEMVEALGPVLSTANGVRALEKLLSPRNNGTGPQHAPTPKQTDLERYYSTPTR